VDDYLKDLAEIVQAVKRGTVRARGTEAVYAV
jgi:hypothetical protein